MKPVAANRNFNLNSLLSYFTPKGKRIRIGTHHQPDVTDMLVYLTDAKGKPHMDEKERRKAEARQNMLAAVAELDELLPHVPVAESRASTIQQLFNSYANCQYLTGEPVKDDDGTVLQSAAWLCENRFDDFLHDISHAFVSAGVCRDALMRLHLRHALRILNENPDSLYAGTDDNRNLMKIIDELKRERNSDEFLREKVSKIADGLPVPLGLQFM
jgi:hypothetical protein